MRLERAAQVMVNHASGDLMAWLKGPQKPPTVTLIGCGDGAAGSGACDDQNLLPPGHLPLHGAAMHLRSAPQGGRLLHLMSDRPLVAWIGGENGTFQTRFFPHGMLFHWMMPTAPQGKGPDSAVQNANSIILEPLGSEKLGGVLRYRGLGALEIKGDGTLPPLRMAPGEARFYRFKVPKTGPVGLAIGGEADAGVITLYDQAGRAMASGRTLMQTLETGVYHFKAALPPDSATQVVQPAVVGLSAPGGGPPPEVVQDFRSKYQGK